MSIIYLCTEKIKDENHLSVPVKKSVRFKQLVMPYYDKMDIDKWNPIYINDDLWERVYA